MLSDTLRILYLIGAFLALTIYGYAQEGPLLDPEQAPLDIRPQQRTAAKGPSPLAGPHGQAAIKIKSRKTEDISQKNVSELAPVRLQEQQTKITAADTIPTQNPATNQPVITFEEAIILKYCTHVSNAASDGRLAWQAKRIEDMDNKLRMRIAELETKRSEVEDWLRRREDALRKADDALVAVYSKMKPDAAAQQFSAMDEAGAAAILIKLNPRMASTVLNEIDPSRAARIAAEMAGVTPSREAARVLQ